MELWKEIDNYSNYMVSNYGRIMNTKTGSILKGDKQRYHRVQLGKGNPKLSVHRLVADAFIPNPNNLPEVNHIDENKLNNYVGNLEWVTSAQNKQHSYSKFNKSDIVKIREMYSTGKYTQYQLAEIYNCARTTIQGIVSMKRWLL